MNKTILENNKKLDTINFNYNLNKAKIGIKFNDHVDNIKYRNKLHNQKIDYVLNAMNFKIEKNIFKKVFIGFKLVINRILNIKRKLKLPITYINLEKQILKDFLFILFVQCGLIAFLILILIELSIGGF